MTKASETVIQLPRMAREKARVTLGNRTFTLNEETE